MAQQTLDFVISQQVTGQAEVAKLIKQVGALDAEMQKLRAATASMSGGFTQAAGVIRGNTNVLDAQSKALRNQRQGIQQVGMQLNDFATSVSTGASVSQAFNQQLGQLGYAMSMMEGAAGRVGTFLAGPWGAAITVAVAALGYLADKFFESGEEAEKAKQKTEEYTEVSYAHKMASESLIGVTDELNRLSGRYTLTIKEQAAAVITIAKAKILEKERTLDLAIAQAALNEERLKGYRLTQQIQGFGGGDGARAAAGSTAFLAGRAESSLEETKKRIGELRKQLGSARSALEYLETNGPSAGADREGRAARSVRAVREETSELEKQIKALTEKYAPQAGALEVARVAYERGAITLAQYNNELSEYLGLTDRQMKLQTPKVEDFSEITRAIGDVKPVEDLDESIKKTTESLQAKKQAVDNISQAVGNGFQGMLTGAKSFGDAMKGIIQSVIDELFRLFVVQQIVGFVSKTVSSAFKLPDGKALGGSVTANTPYIVGEKGPELFMPGKSGTVIPTQNTRGMGAGGSVINVSVDARGSTDPEAVRQQVQRGILEAAPSIVAAAEQRTISTLRRPRLGGVL